MFILKNIICLPQKKKKTLKYEKPCIRPSKNFHCNKTIFKRQRH